MLDLFSVVANDPPTITMPINAIDHRPNAISNEKIKIDFKRKAIQVEVNVADFIDHGHVVAYVPSLDISAYGPTRAEAFKMLFKEVLTDFFENLLKLPEAEVSRELAKHGWKRGSLLRKNYSNKAFVDAKGILQNFNLPSETQISISHHEDQLIAA